MLVTDTGRAIQIPVDGISIIGRNTKGVRLMRVADDERIVSVARMVEADEAEDELLEDVMGDAEAESLESGEAAEPAADDASDDAPTED